MTAINHDYNGAIHRLISDLAMPLGSTQAAKTEPAGFKKVIKEGLVGNPTPEITLSRLSQNYPNITINRLSKSGKSEPPAQVAKGLNEWLSSVEHKTGFDTLAEIVLEEGNDGAHASEGRLTVGENLFNHGYEHFNSVLNHEFEHLQDEDLIHQHLKHLLSNANPGEIQAVLFSGETALIHHHYENVLDSTAGQLAGDSNFVALLNTIEIRTRDVGLSNAIRNFLGKEITKESLGSLGHVLAHKKEGQAVDKYIRKQYGIPSLSSFASKPFNLRKVDDRLAELNGSPRMKIFPDLSSTFAGLSADEKAELYRGTPTAKKNISTLMQIAHDAGKIEHGEFAEITGTSPSPEKIYQGPSLAADNSLQGELAKMEANMASFIRPL